MGIHFSPGVQHAVFPGRYVHGTVPDGQSDTGSTLCSFDARIGSMTDFQSARDHDESAPTVTPLIKYVGVPLAPKYHQTRNDSFSTFFSLCRELPREQAYFHETRVSKLMSSLAMPARNFSLVTTPV